MNYITAFIAGGIICGIGQIIIDKTMLTPARLLTGYVCLGVLLSLTGFYEKFAKWAGGGATVPLTGFGYTLFNGVKKAVAEKGFPGIFTGGLTAASGGIAAVMLFAVFFSLFAKPKSK